MTVRRRQRTTVIAGLLALVGAAAVLPCLHTCLASAPTTAALQATHGHGASDATHAGCRACTLGRTLRVSPAVEAGVAAPIPAVARVAGASSPAPVATDPEASADPRAPPSRT